MIICVCHRITDQEIHRLARAGVRDFETLQDETCLGRNCESCIEAAHEVLAQALDSPTSVPSGSQGATDAPPQRWNAR